MRSFPRRMPVWNWLVGGHVALLLTSPLQGQTFTRADQIRDLPPAEAGKGHSVKLHGVITFFKSDWNGLFMQDETGGAYVKLSPAVIADTPNLQPGQIIEVKGKTDAGALHADVAAASLRILGTGPLPAPLDLSNTNLLIADSERLLVKASGQIFNISDLGGRPRLHLATSAGLFLNVDCQS